MGISAWIGGGGHGCIVGSSSERRRAKAPAGGRGLVAVSLAVLVACLLAAAGASAAPLVWNGEAVEHHWSALHNWDGELAPSMGEPSELEFPHLSGCSGSSSCYSSENDLSGLKVESIKIDNGDEYQLSGKEIDLGSGGLTVAPAAGTSGPAGDVFELPIHLSAPQSWSITGRSGGAYGENGAAVVGDVSGPESLAVGIGKGNSLILANETEVGSVTLEGQDTNEAGVLNGFIELAGDIDFLDGGQVDLNHMFMIGPGALGALHTDHGELVVGIGGVPTEGVLADSATFDKESKVGFEIAGEHDVAGEDYSQLHALGNVELNGVELELHVSPPSEGSACPTLRAGQTYVLVATEGSLSGTFANASEGGPEIPIGFAKRCSSQSQTMQIAYHRSGAVETVTATVEAKAYERQLERENQEARERKLREERERTEREQREREEAQHRQEATEHEQGVLKELEEVSAKAAVARAAEEASKREAEQAARKRQEEELARSASQEEGGRSTPSPSLAVLSGSTLSEQRGRRALVKLTCKGPGSCTGRLVLRSGGRRLRQIGTEAFTIAAHRTVTVAIALDAVGRSLLRAGRDRLSATLAIETHGAPVAQARVRLVS